VFVAAVASSTRRATLLVTLTGATAADGINAMAARTPVELAALGIDDVQVVDADAATSSSGKGFTGAAVAGTIFGIIALIALVGAAVAASRAARTPRGMTPMPPGYDGSGRRYGSIKNDDTGGAIDDFTAGTSSHGDRDDERRGSGGDRRGSGGGRRGAGGGHRGAADRGQQRGQHRGGSAGGRSGSTGGRGGSGGGRRRADSTSSTNSASELGTGGFRLVHLVLALLFLVVLFVCFSCLTHNKQNLEKKLRVLPHRSGQRRRPTDSADAAENGRAGFVRAKDSIHVNKHRQQKEEKKGRGERQRGRDGSDRDDSKRQPSRAKGGKGGGVTFGEARSDRKGWVAPDTVDRARARSGRG
jgi:hypothetical protein